MTDRNDLILNLRVHGVALHCAGEKGKAHLFGRAIEALLKDEHPSLRRALASELQLSSRSSADAPTLSLIQEAVSELAPSASVNA
jgi:hypothetical protein